MSTVQDVTRTPLAALLVIVAVVTAACGADVAVTATRSESSPAGEATNQTTGTDPGDPVPDPGTTTEPGTESTESTEPGTESTEPDLTTSEPATTEPTITADPVIIDPEAIDFGPDKPERPYDDFLLASLSDLNTWWAAVYPEIYGEPWVPLEGDVYAAYPQRPNDIPGCGTPLTTYDDVQEFVAFYCGLGDFIVYDDGDDGLLTQLADNFGAGTIGIVLAHEYGHAIQQRSGTLNRNLPTVTTEQQADCFAGAWAARAARGDGGVTFSDADVRAGLIAMLEVRDPVGINQFTPGGHGSGFDRVGAFQTGFVQGPVRCGDLIDDPLPLMPNEFNDRDDLESNGNAPFGYGSGELLGFLVDDLNLFWGLDASLDAFDPLTLVPVQAPGDATCPDLEPGLEVGAALCPATGTVFLNEPEALDFYNQLAFGDFSIGYLIGIAWAEAAQRSLGSTLVGEARELNNDCLAGAWVKSVIPVDLQLPLPRAEGRTAAVSPGDLDEAIRTAIVIGDLGADDDIIGSPFEKIDAFRAGVLGGLDACAT